MFSCSKDEVHIIGYGDIDDVEEEPHVETSLPSVHVEPIAKCSGLSWLEWMNLEVILFSESGVPIEEGVWRNTHLHDCIDQYPLGNEDIGVVILELLV